MAHHGANRAGHGRQRLTQDLEPGVARLAGLHGFEAGRFQRERAGIFPSARGAPTQAAAALPSWNGCSHHSISVSGPASAAAATSETSRWRPASRSGAAGPSWIRAPAPGSPPIGPESASCLPARPTARVPGSRRCSCGDRAFRAGPLLGQVRPQPQDRLRLQLRNARLVQIDDLRDLPQRQLLVVVEAQHRALDRAGCSRSPRPAGAPIRSAPAARTAGCRRRRRCNAAGPSRDRRRRIPGWRCSGRGSPPATRGIRRARSPVARRSPPPWGALQALLGRRRWRLRSAWPSGASAAAPNPGRAGCPEWRRESCTRRRS